MITLYHGTKCSEPILFPDPQKCRGRPDFGKAFYLTHDEEQASQWATKDGQDGYVQEFRCDYTGLKIFNFLEIPDSKLLWLGTLAKCRLNQKTFLSKRSKWLAEHVAVDVSKYDVIIGHLGDDKISDILEDFCYNRIPLEGAVNALRFTELSPQYAIRSNRALLSTRTTNVGVKKVFSISHSEDKHERSKKSVAYYNNLKLYFLDAIDDEEKRKNMTFLSDIYKEYRNREDEIKKVYKNIIFSDSCSYNDTRQYDEDEPSWRWRQ